MKVVIFCGGLGTRLREETEFRPKPMVPVGERPILWHILKRYSQFGLNDFAIALGYKGEFVKRFFTEYAGLVGSLSVNLASGRIDHHEKTHEDWQVHLVETGELTNTGGRVRRLAPWLKDGTFQLTYGDGVADIDIDALVHFHRRMGRAVTLTAVRPPARFGGILFDGDTVSGFTEKSQAGEGWINGGFMVCEPRVLDLIAGDDCSFERDVLERLAAEGQLAAYRHHGFWQCMDTLRDKRQLEDLWASGTATWLDPVTADRPQTNRRAA